MTEPTRVEGTSLKALAEQHIGRGDDCGALARAVMAFLTERSGAGGGEAVAVAYLYQHDETTRCVLRLPDERMNEAQRRYVEIPLFAQPSAEAADAERYRTLRNGSFDAKVLFARIQEHPHEGELWGELSMMLAGEELDKAIDSARSRG